MDSKEFTIELNQTNNIEVYLDITGDYILTTDDVNKAEKIVKALEKQIPKKPLFKTDYSAYEYYYACPSCGALVAEHMNYCSGNRDYGEPSERGCGQKLDWGD